MNIHHTIKQRRSVFPGKYTQGSILEEHMEQILDAARWAPTHKKTEPWRYKVVSGEGLKRLGSFMGEEHARFKGNSTSLKSKKFIEKMQRASAIILIFMNRDKKERIPEWEEIAAVSMSVQNMWLTASSLGYGAYWSSPKSYADMNRMKELGIEENDQFLGFLYLGTRMDEEKKELPKRKSIEEFVKFID